MKTPHFEAQSRIDTPLGPLTLAATARGLALAWFDGQAHRSEEIDAPPDPDHPHLALAAREFAAYWRHARTRFTVPLDPQGTAFQQAVWQVLRGIAPGSLASYGEVAQRIGKPAAVRAVGAAIGRNPIAIVVPCHRVVGRDGSLTGYAAGLPRKQALLEREGALPARA
jgi:methylated-DNA-[protein]-cysteine S-methyltransferase